MTKSNGHQKRRWPWEDEHVMWMEPTLDYVETLLCPRGEGLVGTVRTEVTLAQQGPTTDGPVIFYERDF